MRQLLYLIKYSLLIATILRGTTFYKTAVFIVAAMKHPNLISQPMFLFISGNFLFLVVPNIVCFLWNYLLLTDN
jgi:hypothetical protein